MRVITKNTPETGQHLPDCQILGIRVHPISLKQAISLLETWVESNKQYQIITPNPEQVVLAQKYQPFREALNRADLAIPDGIGLVWAIKRLGGQAVRVERVAGADLMVALSGVAAKKNWRVFLLGARNAAALTANKLQLLFPQLQVMFDRGSEAIAAETTSERKRIINKINQFRPHLLFVAYGAPYQELWIAKNLPLLRTKVAMGVGGAFDYLAGKIPRAPKWLQDLGLEWLYRLMREPWRWKRQLALLKFVWSVLRERRKVYA